MEIDNVNNILVYNDLEGSSYFVNPSFESAIIGYTEDKNIIYSYDLMVESLMLEDDISMEDAMEFIDFNTIRTIPYMPSPRPIIMYGLI